MPSEHYLKYKEGIKKRTKDWRKRNPEKVKEIRKRYREKHKDQINASHRNWRKRNPEKVKAFPSNNPEKQRKYRARLKEKIFKLLGGECSNPFNLPHPDWCNDWRCLQIDHINGNGKKEIGSFQSYGGYQRFVLEQIMNGSKDYQLLCANCNWIKGRRG